MEKFGGGKGVTNDNTVWRIVVACWIRKATRAHGHAY